MTLYRIEFVAPTTFVAYVDADSESAARQAFVDGDVDEIFPADYETYAEGQSLDEFTSTTVIKVEAGEW